VAAQPQGDHQLLLPNVRRRSAGEQVGLRLASQVGGHAQAIVADGRRAWAGIGPRLVGASAVLPGIIEDVALLGSHAYAIVTGGAYMDGKYPAAGVYVFEVLPGAAPRRVGAVLLGFDLQCIVSGGGRLFGSPGGHRKPVRAARRSGKAARHEPDWQRTRHSAASI
jgi:hypothetical protein